MTIALGCMGLSGAYGKTDDAQSIALIQAAIERGITFLDTGDFYGNGHNELLIGKAIAGRRDRVQLSVKFGALRGPDGSWGGFDARPAAVKNFLYYSLVRLGTEHALAKRWDITPSQLAIGWVLAKQPQFTPTLGMRTIQQLDETLAAKPLTAEQVAEVDAIAPRGAVAGTRYPAAMMSTLDSEKR
jgi:aryl-alcohol dehydrogenase-like predicted oxidoreductase